jgi:hypothetical protein
MKPILFNIEMVRAIMEGRKTVTRRVVKPQPPATSVVRKRGCAWDWSFWADCNMGHVMKLPYHPGDILWVRETWNGDWCDHYIYKADGGSAKSAGYTAEPKWHPSIHMPREAARLFLRVTDVRVERLQDINLDPPGPKNQVVREGLRYLSDFIAVWDRTIKPADLHLYGWDANPWIQVIEFERISKEQAFGGGGDGCVIKD